MTRIANPRVITVTLAHPSSLAASIRRLPGDRDVWVFIMAELLMFGVFFVAYIVQRRAEVTLFNASQATLDRTLGGLNTLILITSSWAVVRAAEAGRARRNAAVVRRLGVAIALALAFVAVKGVEYSAKFDAGINLTTNSFYMFYFSLTMVHLFHVVGGTVILIVVRQNAKGGEYHPASMKGLEAGASYWHMVDLLWIFLFALLYLLR
jgi:nitric oxide reductase NorE protein